MNVNFKIEFNTLLYGDTSFIIHILQIKWRVSYSLRPDDKTSRPGPRLPPVDSDPPVCLTLPPITPDDPSALSLSDLSTRATSFGV